MNSMNHREQTQSRFRSGTKWVMLVALTTFSISCYKSTVYNHPELRNFEQVNLVANAAVYHPVTVDPTLLNAFGVDWSPTGVAWVNSVGGHVSELYSGEGDIVRKPVNIPFSKADSTGGLPTGIVFTGGKGFNLVNGPSVFLFAGFDGVVSGWNPALGNNARGIKKVARSNYTGLAIASDRGRNLIYAANFGANRIDVWDTAFSEVNMRFRDPGLPAEYSPYNIQAVGDKLFVMYAQLSNTGGTVGHVAGAGKGFVSIFNTDGSFVKRFASRGTLNIPWGITQAPAGFVAEHNLHISIKQPVEGGQENAGGNPGNQYPKEPVVLVGNFGDGRINVYSLDGGYLGQLQAQDQPIVIDGLWALSFAPSTATAIDPARLYFTAGPNNETDGLFGYLIKK
jgi:uncharacterized protein (TIGR03118 family)